MRVWRKPTSSSITLRDLAPSDIRVLSDLVRFGVLADDQIARRYRQPDQLPHQNQNPDQASVPTPDQIATRLAWLVDGGLVKPWPPLVQDTPVYSATAIVTRIIRSHLRATQPSLGHLRHDIALVDLADYLLEHTPGAEWRTEREVGRVLHGADGRTRIGGLPNSPSHKPDGLLLLDGQRLAIELEHTDKGDLRYAYICRWFALTISVDAVRWYVDDPKTIARLRRVHQEHGFQEDVDFSCQPFPPGVMVRPWSGR